MARRNKRRTFQSEQDRFCTINSLLMATGAFVCVVLVLIVMSVVSNSSAKAAELGAVFASPSDVPNRVVSSLDAVFVLGGGVPASLEEPPPWVQRRCDDAAAVLRRRQADATGNRKLPVLCLSAGTAHVPQLLGADGLPIWESTSSAAYLQTKHNLRDDEVYVETTSYDTIGNAYYARIGHADVVGWKRVLVITNEVCSLCIVMKEHHVDCL